MIVNGMCLGIGWDDLGWNIFHKRYLGMGAYSLGIVLDFIFFFSHSHIWWELRKCTHVHAYFMIGTGMCLGIGGVENFSQKMFRYGCLLLRDSVGLCFFFHPADMMRALKMYKSACMVHDRYWYVSGDRLHWFGVKNFSWQTFGNGCLLPRDMHTYTHLHTTHTCMHTHTCIHTCMHTHTCIHTCMHTHTYMHAYTHILTCIHTHTHILTCIHTHMHMWQWVTDASHSMYGIL